MQIFLLRKMPKLALLQYIIKINQLSKLVKLALIAGIIIASSNIFIFHIYSQSTGIIAIKSPVSAGQTLRITHGYNDPLPTEGCTIPGSSDHCSNQRYGLDLVPSDQADKRILSPTEGTIIWLGAGAEGRPCLGLLTTDNLNMNICHFGRFAVNPKQHVNTGDLLGERGDNSWIHLSLDDRNHGFPYKPYPFIGVHAIDGKDFPDLGSNTRNQYLGIVITSTNNATNSPATGDNQIPIDQGSTPPGDSTVSPIGDISVSTKADFLYPTIPYSDAVNSSAPLGYLNSCATSTNIAYNAVSKGKPTQQNLVDYIFQNSTVVTIKENLPMWAWLNTPTQAGTKDSPFTTPCSLSINNNVFDNHNYANEYSICASGQTFNGHNICIPLRSNGIGCLRNDYENINDPQTSNSWLTAINTNQSIPSELNTENNQIKLKFNTTSKSSSTPQSDQTITTSSLMVNMCTADNKIDSVYTGDVYNSPEFVVNSQLASDSISDIVLPEATLSLKVAYQKEGFENSALSASNQKIIHRNRLGLAFNVTKNIYKLPKTIGTQILGATTQGSSQPYLSPVYNGKGSLEYSEKTTLYYPWLGQIREIYKRLSNVLTDTSGNYNSKGLYNQTIKPVEDNITLASNDSSNNTPFDFSYKASNSATVINFNYDKIITDLKSANNLATCSDLDSFSDFINLNVKKINDSSVKTNLLSAITHTDCIGNKADFDPLESYLCNYLPNGIPNCNLATYINKSANTITTPDGYSCVSNIPTGSTTVTPIVESGADNKVTIIGEASNSVTIHSPINGATAKLISQPLHDGHPAIDYAVPTGTEVHAATDGFVVYAGVATNASASCHSLYNTPNGGFGNVIMIEYNNCLSSVYAHLNDFNVKVGQHVTAGDVIAHVDHSGNVSGGNGGDGSHLHFELRSCAGNGPGVPEYSYLKDDPNQYKYIYDPTCLFDSSAKCRIEKSAALNPSTSIDPTSCNNNAGNSPSSSSTALPTSNLTSSSSPNGDTSQLAQCQISDDNYSGATFDPTYSSDNLSKRVLNSCGFNFSNSNFTADKAKQIVDSYGCLTDRVEYNVYQSRGGNYSVGPTQILQRRQVRNTRIDQIFAATGNNTGLAAAAFCTWFAESGSGFSNGVGRGLDCGIGSADCNPNTPVSNLGCSRVDKSTKERLSCTDPNDLEKIFSNELSCLTKTNPACTLVSHSDASGNDLSVFYPEKPGPWLENYGPVSDGNASYADKVIRCMTYIVGAGRTDAQGNIYSPQADGTLKDSKGNGFTHDQNNIATNDGSWVKDDFTKLGCYPFPNTTNLYPSIIYSGVSCNDNFLTQPDKFQQKT